MAKIALKIVFKLKLFPYKIGSMMKDSGMVGSTVPREQTMLQGYLPGVISPSILAYEDDRSCLKGVPSSFCRKSQGGFVYLV